MTVHHGGMTTVAFASRACVGWAAALAAAALTGCVAPRFAWHEQTSGTTVDLRGLCAVDAQTAWASGGEGTVLRTVDGGATWEPIAVAGGETRDFRDVHALDERTAWLLAAGSPARVYHTADGGATWTVQLDDPDPAAFFDAFAFWDERAGVLFGDPVAGRFAVLTTADQGATWQPVDPSGLPAPVAGEAGFAASGTSAAVWGEASAWVCTGGADARVLRTTDRGRSWLAAPTPLRRGTPSAGGFSIAFRSLRHGVVVGGDHQQPDAAGGNAAWSEDGGATWNASEQPPRGYRSCVEFVPSAFHRICVAVGPSGVDYSVDGGQAWLPLRDEGYHVVSFTTDGPTGWVAGAGGRIAKLVRPQLLEEWTPPER
jgi:photosystem II stability/assembly factor-like uncharacterized protein